MHMSNSENQQTVWAQLTATLICLTNMPEHTHTHTWGINLAAGCLPLPLVDCCHLIRVVDKIGCVVAKEPLNISDVVATFVVTHMCIFIVEYCWRCGCCEFSTCHLVVNLHLLLVPIHTHLYIHIHTHHVIWCHKHRIAVTATSGYIYS